MAGLLIYNSPMDILKLIEKCIAHDEEAWIKLYRIYGAIAYNILLKHFSSLDETQREDIIQNVFKKLLEGGLNSFRGITEYEFLKYFNIIVINEARTYIKTIPDWGSIEEDIQNCHSLQDRLVEQRTLLEELKEILRTFDLQDQRIFWYKANGYKDKEISRMLGIPVGTVASRYSRTVSKIRMELIKKGVELEDT